MNDPQKHMRSGAWRARIRLWVAIGAMGGCGAGPEAQHGTRAPIIVEHGGAVTLSNGLQVGVQSFSEVSSAEPGASDATVPVVTLEVDGDALELRLDPHRPDAARGWVDEHRFSLASVARGSVALWVDRRTEDLVENSTRLARVARNQTIPLDQGLHLRFSGHSHKQVLAKVPESPLIVSIDYLRAHPSTAADSEAFELVEARRHNLFPPEQATWVWRDHQVHLVHHLYNGRMDLELSKRTMVPVEVRSGE